MDLKALQQLQNKSQNLQSQRHQESANHYQQGLVAFAQAAGQNFRDKQALKTAFDCWMESIKSNRQNPEPCIGVGYVFMILGDTRTALMYFKSAQRLQPNHPDAALFVDYLVQLSSQKKPLPPVGLPVKPAGLPGHPAGMPAQSGQTAITDDDYDAMYDRAEHLLDFHLKQMMSLPGLEPCLSSSDRKAQAQLCEDQQEILAEIKKLVKTIEDEIDTAPLEKQLQVLERALKRLQTVYGISQQFGQIAQRIKTERQQAEAQLEQVIQGSAPEAEQVLEALLDSCDQLADELESIENQKYSIAALEPLYQGLVDAVTQLQEKLDDRD